MLVLGDALDGRLRLQRAVDAALEGVDALVLPTLPIVAPPIGAGEIVVDPSSQARMTPRAAIDARYRFYSYGDAMLITRPGPFDRGRGPGGEP